MSVAATLIGAVCIGIGLYEWHIAKRFAHRLYVLFVLAMAVFLLGTGLTT